ncbi:hypothetical protein EJ995_05000 [Nonlabens ponticola]|uniref:Outer membrane protein n=2 Tax=Nonlabens ponticola TaxID=2496866 RepID=A0A3S9N0X2_9FLAO|nr:hypothetical protein EJ995_05000 [Nonlabens ponticola]
MAGVRTYADSVHINLNNPAAYAGLRLTSFTVGGVHTETFASSNAGDDEYDATSIEYVSLGIPLGRKAGFGFGLIPFQSVGYTIGEVNDVRYTRFTGEGSLNRAYFAAGAKLTPELSIGGEFRYNFGQQVNRSSIALDGVEFGTRIENESDIGGVSFNFGLHYDKRLKNGNNLQGAVTFQPQSDITARNTRRLSRFVLQADLAEAIVDTDESDEQKQDLNLSSDLTIGIGYGKSRQWNLAGEYSRRGTGSQVTRSFAPDNVNYNDAASYRLGGFYIPKFNSLTSYWDRVVYRGGLRYEQTGIELSGQDISEFGISFGLGLPIGRGASFSSANIGLEYGQRGTQDAGLIKEDFFSISIGISLSDKWFQKRRYN